MFVLHTYIYYVIIYDVTLEHVSLHVRYTPRSVEQADFILARGLL